MQTLLPPETLRSLAPLQLTNYRQLRYLGDDLCLPLEVFTPDDQGRLCGMYNYLLGLQKVLGVLPGQAVEAEVLAYTHSNPVSHLLASSKELGRSSYAAHGTPLMAKTLHDLRGGAWMSLLGHLQLSATRGLDTATMETLYFLTRDHLKIMRNALLGLDDEQRNADLQPRPHGTDLIVQKWQNAELHPQGTPLRVRVACEEGTAIGECCVEFAAIDRILYNLANNAARHAVGDTVDLVMLSVPGREGGDLRFVLCNAASAEDLRHLRSISCNSLFEEGVSTTGSGYGLAIVAEFVSHAYGLATTREALTGGYLGARVVDDSFVTWFHWPKVGQN